MALSKLHKARLTFPVVIDKLHHPIDFALPFREIGKKNTLIGKVPQYLPNM